MPEVDIRLIGDLNASLYRVDSIKEMFLDIHAGHMVTAELLAPFTDRGGNPQVKSYGIIYLNPRNIVTLRYD